MGRRKARLGFAVSSFGRTPCLGELAAWFRVHSETIGIEFMDLDPPFMCIRLG